MLTPLSCSEFLYSPSIHSVWHKRILPFRQVHANAAKQAAVDAMYETLTFQLCNRLCNQGKHLVLEKKKGKPAPIPMEAEKTKGAVSGNMMLGDPGSALGTAPRWQLLCEREVIEPIGFAETLAKQWEKFFVDNGIKLRADQ